MTCATAKGYAAVLPRIGNSELIADPPFNSSQVIAAVLGLKDYYQAPTTNCYYVSQGQFVMTVQSPFETPSQRGRMILGILDAVRTTPSVAGTLFGRDLKTLAFALTHEQDPNILTGWLSVAGYTPLVQATLAPILDLAAGIGLGGYYTVQKAALEAAASGLSLATGAGAITWAQRVGQVASDSADVNVRSAAAILLELVQALLNAAHNPLPGSVPVPEDPPIKIPRLSGAASNAWWVAGAGAILAAGLLGGAWWLNTRRGSSVLAGVRKRRKPKLITVETADEAYERVAETYERAAKAAAKADADADAAVHAAQGDPELLDAAQPLVEKAAEARERFYIAAQYLERLDAQRFPKE